MNFFCQVVSTLCNKVLLASESKQAPQGEVSGVRKIPAVNWPIPNATKLLYIHTSPKPDVIQLTLFFTTNPL